MPGHQDTLKPGCRSTPGVGAEEREPVPGIFRTRGAAALVDRWPDR
jgi:hypothetical protein